MVAEVVLKTYVVEDGRQASAETVLADVLTIHRLCFPTPWPDQTFRDELARPWAYVGILRETTHRRALAFCNYWIVADELQILTVAVHPDQRRQGHATRLVEHMLDHGKSAHVQVATLEVRASNQPAQALYRKLGFRDVGRRPKYYADNGEDAVLMDRDMPP